MKVHINQIVMTDTSLLKEHPYNKKIRRHSKEAIERTAEILEYQGWRYPIKVSNRSGFITAGHKRLYAAQLKGWKEVPVSFQNYENEDQEIADLISDNALNEWDVTDRAGVNEIIAELGPDFNVDWLGLSTFTLDFSDKELPEKKKKTKTCPGCGIEL